MDTTHDRHVVTVTPTVRGFRVDCLCGLTLYHGPNQWAGERAENRHIRDALTVKLPRSQPSSEFWSWFGLGAILGWLLGDD